VGFLGIGNTSYTVDYVSRSFIWPCHWYYYCLH